MNPSTIAVMITILAVYALICYYLGYNGWVWLRQFQSLRKYKYLYAVLVVFLSVSLFIGRFLPFPVLSLIGGYWMVIVGYSLLILPIINVAYFLMKKRGLMWIGIGVLAFFTAVFINGTYNAWNPVVRSYDIHINKQADRDQLKILMASDFHLGSIVGKDHLERFIKIVENEKPDIVLIPGDLIDDYIEPFQDAKMGENLKKIDAPLGVFAALGNHDYYGGDKKEIVEEMEKAGITVLQDQTISIGDNLFISGRKDPTDPTRGNITDFIGSIDHTKPLIMMDHQPIALEEAKEAGVDLLVSGHTHRGQVAPANLITDTIFENDWGYLQKGSLHSFVSSGFGTWGPALRIGTRSEVMVIHVSFK